MTFTVRREPPASWEMLHPRNKFEIPAVHAQDWATFYLDGHPVAVWGLLQRWPGIADLIGTVTDGVRGHGLSFVRWSAKLLARAAYDRELRRVTAYVLDNSEYMRFAQAMGFNREHTMADAGPHGELVHIYVRFYPWAALAEEARTLSLPHPRSLTTLGSGGTTPSGRVRPSPALTRM